MNRILAIVLISLVTYQHGFAQSKKEGWMMRQLVDTPTLLTLDQFLPEWFRGHACRISDGFGNYTYMQEIGRDSHYAYFKYETKMRYEKYKVLMSDLARVKFDTWKACDIKDDFFMTAVAAKDMKRQPDLLICTSTPAVAKYTFTYIPNTNMMRIDLHWKIYCEIIFKLVNKKYCGMYDFNTGTFIDIQ